MGARSDAQQHEIRRKARQRRRTTDGQNSQYGKIWVGARWEAKGGERSRSRGDAMGHEGRGTYESRHIISVQALELLEVHSRELREAVRDRGR